MKYFDSKDYNTLLIEIKNYCFINGFVILDALNLEKAYAPLIYISKNQIIIRIVMDQFKAVTSLHNEGILDIIETNINLVRRVYFGKITSIFDELNKF